MSLSPNVSFGNPWHEFQRKPNSSSSKFRKKQAWVALDWTRGQQVILDSLGLGGKFLVMSRGQAGS